MKRVIIDVREPDEYAEDHIDGALNIPMSKLSSFPDIPKDTEIILYCRSGARAGRALDNLRAQGYTNVTNGINQREVTAHYL